MDTNQMPEQAPASNGSPDQGHKKVLLQKLMTNLLSKPGRSMHEIINGVKDAMGAYKNYSKEWDNLNGLGDMAKGVAAGGAIGGAAPAIKGGSSKIQDILNNIQSKKAPNIPMQQLPKMMPMQPVQQMPLPRAQAMPMQAPTSMPPAPPAPPMPPQGQQARPGQPSVPGHGPMPMPPMPPKVDDLVAGQPQQSNFNRPAPTNSLGIHGF